MGFGDFRVTLSGWGASLRIPDCPKLLGNERISSRAFQRAPVHPKRTSLDKVTALQRWKDFSKIQVLSIGNPSISPKRVRSRKLVIEIVWTVLCTSNLPSRVLPRTLEYVSGES